MTLGTHLRDYNSHFSRASVPCVCVNIDLRWMRASSVRWQSVTLNFLNHGDQTQSVGPRLLWTFDKTQANILRHVPQSAFGLFKLGPWGFNYPRARGRRRRNAVGSVNIRPNASRKPRVGFRDFYHLVLVNTSDIYHDRNHTQNMAYIH